MQYNRQLLYTEYATVLLGHKKLKQPFLPYEQQLSYLKLTLYVVHPGH